jgi:hypothetical protein
MMISPIGVDNHGSIPLRLVWPLEAQDFTPWLIANLDRLGAALGRTLRALPNKAVGVGRIADLFARDEADGSLVVIENQLEPTDDAHLGQILAYLAQSEATTLVWIAQRFEERHAQVVRWLNHATTPDHCFFAVQARVERHADQKLDVIFDVVVAPSDWVKPSASRPPDQSRLDFAASFWVDHLHRFPDEALLSRQVGPRSRWRSTPLKRVVIGLHVEPNGAAVFIRGRNGVPLSDVSAALAPFASEIETALGVELGQTGAAVLAQTRHRADLTVSATWPATSDWLYATARRYGLTLSSSCRVLRSGVRR